MRDDICTILEAIYEACDSDKIRRRAATSYEQVQRQRNGKKALYGHRRTTTGRLTQ